MGRFTISMPDELEERINEQLEYGDNRSKLIRELIREGLDRREGNDTRDNSDTPPPPAPADPPTDDTPLPDSVPQTVAEDDARTAIEAAVAYVREHGGASRADLVRDVMPDERCGYELPDEPSGYRGSWWRKIVRPGLGEHPEVEPPARGASEYRYRG